jgi:SAM-dependent MidA family methyltransferase
MQPQSQSNPLEEWVRRKLLADGPVPFATFMDWALYHPKLGYYSAGPNIGPRGDFTTSPEASPLFGRLLAHHIAEIDSLLGAPTPFDIIECGPGLGTLAADLLGELRQSFPALYSRTRYWLVEISSALTRLQKEKLRGEHGNWLSWATDLRSLPSRLQGALLANEVVDAFPVHILENIDGGLQELYVAPDSSGFRFMPGPLSSPRLAEYIDRYGIVLMPGQRIEVSLQAEDWLTNIAYVFDRMVATLIDYGDVSPGRYSEARRQGTLLGYFGGAVTDNVLAHPGRQDLTALVDFTALQDGAAQAGLTVLGLTRQANFLLGLGLGTTLTAESWGNNLESALQSRRGMQALVSPEGMGRFHVLMLGKGVSREQAEASLSGLKYKDVV